MYGIGKPEKRIQDRGGAIKEAIVRIERCDLHRNTNP
jgi:hypothetical protein